MPVATEAPATFVPQPAEPRRAGDGFDVRWYLAQYVRSFDAGGGGSEYFRLAVDAYAVELAQEICGHVRDGSANATLRVHLAAILGTPRFARQAHAIDALLVMLRHAAADPVAIAALDALRAIGDAGVFEVRFAPTGYRVKAVRIVLDTDRRPGWCEIDAVALLGADGNSWAQDATASSSYGS